MNEQQIRDAVDEVRRATEADDAKAPAALFVLAAQVFVDLHRIADALETMSAPRRTGP